MNRTDSWSHSVELEWQGRQEAQSLSGWAVCDVLSSMPWCLPSSLRSVQLPLDHLVEMRDRAVCHQRSNGRRSHAPVWWDPVMGPSGEEEGSKNRSLGNPSDQFMCFGYLLSPGHLERPTSETSRKDSTGYQILRMEQIIDKLSPRRQGKRSRKLFTCTADGIVMSPQC